MKDLFFMGGPLFMSVLTLLLLGIVAWMIYHYTVAKHSTVEKKLRYLKYGKSIGLYALITGILGQLIGFYDAFSAIEKMGSVSPAMVFAGIKVSMITTLYGMIIYIISLILWFVLSLRVEKKEE
ncbi:MotA/TolQ/ExbB proton channel family protein [Carboxylicivirga linearis]|uniref:MotA/TolQ/ExbB proton channel family protein n=1 Tax=Carboxylicivirga linearis TaxID=1628157 RepID=A0ABS5JTF3_9BACT|nr:MotA/TolQ/ExbB proton channel family protein [Carboxylicivirga linearis]MBS2098160.1 MotA/TolQ/ExbB proton channel family protein [Carboxylicivirga linearis]